MSLVFDTSILIEIRNRNKEILDKLEKIRNSYPSPPKISFISYFEFIFGIRNKSEQNKEKEMNFINKFETINTTNKTAEIMTLFKEKYEIPFPDLIIAAQVREHNEILITKDKDFEIITEIKKIIL